jgi:hypothetical protein
VTSNHLEICRAMACRRTGSTMLEASYPSNAFWNVFNREYPGQRLQSAGAGQVRPGQASRELSQ